MAHAPAEMAVQSTVHGYPHPPLARRLEIKAALAPDTLSVDALLKIGQLKTS